MIYNFQRFPKVPDFLRQNISGCGKELAVGVDCCSIKSLGYFTLISFDHQITEIQ